MAIDRIDWHERSTQKYGVPFRAGGVHIGMYLAWIIIRHLEGDNFEECPELVNQVRERRATGLHFLEQACDTKFIDSDLNDEGKAFTAFYYEGDLGYFEDYNRALASHSAHFYAVKDTWANYDILEPWIDTAYAKWKILND